MQGPVLITYSQIGTLGLKLYYVLMPGIHSQYIPTLRTSIYMHGAINIMYELSLRTGSCKA